MSGTKVVSSATPNIVIESPKVRKVLRTIIDTIGGLTFIVGAVDLSSPTLDLVWLTVPIMAAYMAARPVFGFTVDNSNTPSSK